MRSWFHKHRLSIAVVILFSIAFMSLLSLLNVSNINDLGRAISDLRLQIVVTLLLLLILILSAYFSGLRSKTLSNISTNKAKTKQRYRWTGKKWQQQVTEKQNPTWSSDFWQGISTEFVGAVITTLLLGLGVLIFDQYQEIQNRKDELLLQLYSPNNTLAVEAARIMGHEGWLEDGTLYQIDLQGAKLQGANLSQANLQEADLQSANLQETFLIYANLKFVDLQNANLQQAILLQAELQDANLSQANLQGASLWNANLQGAELTSTNLQDANLSRANLQGASLWNANLQGANLELTIFDSDTLLPDAQKILTCNLDETEIEQVELILGDTLEFVEVAALANMEFGCRNSSHTENLDFLGRVLDSGFQLKIYSYDKYWTSETDMSIYTDPNHPDFWQPDWVIEQQENP